MKTENIKLDNWSTIICKFKGNWKTFNIILLQQIMFSVSTVSYHVVCFLINWNVPHPPKKITLNVTPEGVRLSGKMQLSAALCNKIWPQQQIWLMLLWASKLAAIKIECSFEMGK